MLIALPDSGGDLYKQHQLVWSAMHPYTRQGKDFVFGMVSPRLAKVRSTRLPRGAITIPRDGKMEVTLVTSRRNGSLMTALDEAETKLMAKALLFENGFEVDSVEVAWQQSVAGIKIDRETGYNRKIVLPVSHLSLGVRITHRARANLAWRNGIGRGKRFGFGMLQCVQY